MLSGPVLAQPAPTPTPQYTEKISVTGTNIRRVEGETGLPVQVITRSQIEREGLQTANDVVQRLSANSAIGGITPSTSEGTSATGFAAASLRGLGSSRTLVLLNGRRLAVNAFSGLTVDLNSIPLSAIERVEVLTDGASAIYGTDAIAGVINFILRKDYAGFEAYAYYGDSTQGGGAQQNYNVTAGWGDLAKDKFNVFATASYLKTDSIAASQRSFSKTAYLPNATGGNFDRTSGNSIPGNVLIPGKGTFNPTTPTCLAPFSFPTASSPTQCRFDFASVIDIVAPQKIWNVVGSLAWQFNPNHQFFVDAMWSQSKNTARVSPSPISSATLLSGDPVLTIPSSPFYPTALATQFGVNGQALEVFWRGLELGPRTDNYTTTQYRVVAGLQGVLAGWDYTADYNYSQSKADDVWSAGWTKGSVLLPILNSGQINLFGLNTPQALALLQPALIHGTAESAKASSSIVEGKASNDIFNLPAGAVSLAFGAGYEHQTYEVTASDFLSSGDVPGFGGSTPSIPTVSRNDWDVYAEVNVPVFKGFEADLAVRYDDYQNVGNTWNPKVSLRWTPVPSVLMRASAGTGFRAPSLVELDQPAQFGATGGNYTDPARCPTTGSPRDCNAQFTTKGGGNPLLQSEKSDQWSAGGIWEPTPGFSLGADYWWIKIKNVIGQPSETEIFGDIPASEAAGNIVRYAPGSAGCPPSAQTGGIPCPINFGIQTNLNLIQLTVSGWDFNIAYKGPATDYGTFGFALQGTYYNQWDQQSPGGDVIHLAGSFAGNVAATVAVQGASSGAIPRWKQNAFLNWNYGPWLATLQNTYTNSYADASGNRTVGPYTVWSFTGGYTGFKNWTLQAGVKNFMNTNPPYTRQNSTFQVGYDPGMADPTGSFWWASIKYAFK